MNRYIETRPNERYMRFEIIEGLNSKFWEIYIPDRFNIWICEGATGSEGVNRHISWTDLGSADEGFNLRWASKLVNAKEKVGFIYAGEVRKVIDGRYRNALVSQNPHELLDCFKDGYSPFSVVDSKNKIGSAMEIAIAGGVADSVRSLVNAGCNIDQLSEWKGDQSETSISPLIFALKHGNSVEMVELILALGADIDKRTGFESTGPLHTVNSVHLAKLLVGHGANIEAADRFGQTPLIRLLDNSTSDENLEIIQFFINSKANVNARDRVGNTPLIVAAFNANHQVVQMLLDHDADLDACNKWRENALIAIIRRGRGDRGAKAKTIQLLLHAGIDLNFCTKGRATALMVACESQIVSSDIQLLISAGANINAKDKDGQTALMRAVNRSVLMVRFLIKAGAKIDLQNSSGKTAVMLAAMPGHGKKWKQTTLDILIKAGASLAIEDRSGRGVLQTDSVEAAIFLLEVGLLPNAVDGEHLLDLAFRQNHLTLAIKVLEKGEYKIKAESQNFNKKKFSDFIKKISAVNPALLESLTCEDSEIQTLLDKNLKDNLIRIAPEAASIADLPDILKPGAWPSAAKGKTPVLPLFWNAQVHPAPILLSNSKPLPAQAVDTIARMVLMSTYDAPISEIAQIEAVCERQSLEKFAFSIFLEWSDKGSKTNDGLFQVLGYWGDSKAARTLAPLIKYWPKVQLSHRSAMGLEILGSMGSDIALMQISAIAEKTKYDSVRLRAEALLQKVASARNLSSQQLEDRLVPNLELSDDGTMKLDFGPRCFVASVDEQLQPILKDAKGAAIKNLPKATATDDAALAAQSAESWREFKKLLRPLAGLQLARFEHAMSNSRRWLGEDFNFLLLNHPLLQTVIRGLVWAVYKQDSIVSTFSFRSDGAAIDATGNEVAINVDSIIGVPHPLNLANSIEDWKDIFRSSKKAQPFAQLARKIYTKTEDVDGTLFGLEGILVPSLAFKGLKSFGWERDKETFGGTFFHLYRCFPSGTASITLTPGLNLFAYDVIASEQTLSIGCEGLDPIDFSELIRELQVLKV